MSFFRKAPKEWQLRFLLLRWLLTICGECSRYLRITTNCTHFIILFRKGLCIQRYIGLFRIIMWVIRYCLRCFTALVILILHYGACRMLRLLQILFWFTGYAENIIRMRYHSELWFFMHRCR